MTDIIKWIHELIQESKFANLDNSPVPERGDNQMNTVTINSDQALIDLDMIALNEELAASLEKDFDRGAVHDTDVAPHPPEGCELEPALETADTALEVTPATFAMPPTSYMHKGRRYQLICEGACVNCAHCGIKLTDGVSVERGIGPFCARRGYLEDPKNSDEVQAFIDLVEYPELAEYLAAKYKPLGSRALMNGLVKIASLNRHSIGLHSAICDAIDSLGWKKLASTLRESIATLEIKESKNRPDHYQVWVKKVDWSFAWNSEMKRISNLGMYGKLPRGDVKGVLIPKASKRGLWEAILKFFPGKVAKTPDGTVKIERKVVDANSERPSQPSL